MIGDGVAGQRADGEAEALGLDDRLRRTLGMTSDDPKRTWAERVAEALVAAAAKGDARSWSVLFRRAGVGAAADSSGMVVDDETARKILEAARGRVDDLPLD